MNKYKERERLKKYRQTDKRFIMKKIYCVQYDAGMCGTDCAVLVVAESAEEAAESCLDEAINWFWQFQNQPEDEDEEAEMQSDVSPWAEEYNPDKHRGIIHESDADIEALQRECLE